MCDHFLQVGFETELSEIDGGTQAWEAVKRCWHELYAIVHGDGAHDGSPPADGSEPSPSGAGPAAGGGRTNGKRPGAPITPDGDGPGGPGGGDDHPGDEGRGGTRGPKKARMAKGDGPATKFSCPFRKRNPLRFNIREQPACATQFFADMYSLK